MTADPPVAADRLAMPFRSLEMVSIRVSNLSMAVANPTSSPSSSSLSTEGDIIWTGWGGMLASSVESSLECKK